MAAARTSVSGTVRTSAAALLAVASLPLSGTHAEPTRATRAATADDGDDGLRLYAAAPHFRVATRMAPLVAPPAADGAALVREVAAARQASSRGAAPATEPRRLPSGPAGVPVVVRRSKAFDPSTVATATSTPPRRLAPEEPRTLPAAPGGDGADAPEAAIRGMLRDYLSAFNRHDDAALAAHWSGACQSVDLASGDVTEGREAVREVFAALFRADDRATIDIDVESIRLVRHDVAVVDAVSTLAFAGDPGSAARSRLTAVVTREGGRWMLSNVRESAVPAGPSQSPPRELDALDWLVGEWEDAGDGISAHTRCFWSTGHAFLIRCHTAAADGVDRPAAAAAGIPDLLPPGGPGPREITEVIGWDPASASIRSWVFTSEGRFAEGTWTRRGDRWLMRMEGRGADAGTSCTATLERIGTEKLAYRCTGDALADALPPACDFSRTATAAEEASIRR